MTTTPTASLAAVHERDRPQSLPLDWRGFRVILDWDGEAFLSCPSCSSEIEMQFEDNRLWDLVSLAAEHRCRTPSW